MYYSNDEEMKATRIKAHRFIHSQQVKAGVRTDEFDVSSVDNSDIRPGSTVELFTRAPRHLESPNGRACLEQLMRHT